MHKKPRFDPDISLGPVHEDLSSWDELATVPFSGDSYHPPELSASDEDTLVPINIKKSAPSSPSSGSSSIPIRRSSEPLLKKPRPYSELSPAEKRRSDARVGIATAVAAGALVGAGFVGAGASAPIGGALIGGALAAKKLADKRK